MTAPHDVAATTGVPACPRDPAALADPDAVRALVEVALAALARGSRERGGPVPAGGPEAVAAAFAGLDWLPEDGIGPVAAVAELARLLAAGSADPADPWCGGHLHCPPLAVPVAADVVAGALNPSMDSWDQAPAATVVEQGLTAAVARLCFPGAAAPDAVLTTGGSDSNLHGLLLARESMGRVRPVCGRNAHHSVARAAWLLGLPEPVAVDCADDRVRPDALADALARREGPVVVVATAGTTDSGAVDPLPEVADLARAAGAWLHVDAAYGGGLLFSDTRRPLLAGLDRADSIALDLHKFGWQPIAAGLFACRDAAAMRALAVRADYLNADDDTEAGLPDVLGRSLRTSRRPDAVKVAATLRALGRRGVGELVDRCCATAAEVAAAVRAHEGLRLCAEPALSTVLLRPRAADEAGPEAGDAMVARLRRDLLDSGGAVLGRARLAGAAARGPGELWLKLTLLHPHARVADYLPLLDLVAERARA